MALPEKARRARHTYDAAFKAKGDLNTFWQAVAELHIPERADFTRQRDDSDYASEVHDSTPALMRREFGNFLGSALRPKGREWFRGRLRDEELNEQQSVKAFVQKQDKQHRNLLYDNRSGFISQMCTADHDYVTFGNAVTFIDRRMDGTGFVFRTQHLRDCAWMDNQDGETDTMFRRSKMAVKHILENRTKKGWAVSEKITDLLKKEPNRKFEVAHVQMPSDHWHCGDKPKHKDRPWVSAYFCPELEELFLEEEIFQFQFQVSRWFRLPGSPYAVSPAAMISQPDARTMQSMAWSVMQAGELAVEPPIAATSEAVISPVNLFPSGVTWVDKAYDERMGKAIQPIEMGRMPDVGMALHQSMKQQMGDTWFINKLFLPEFNHQMTAQEVERRWEQFLRTTQPIIEPAEPERNGKMLDITHEMAWRSGWMKMDLPEGLERAEMEWTYDNPIEDARLKATLLTFQQVTETTMAAAQIDPTLTAQLDYKTAYRETMSAISPATWLHEEGSEELELAEQAVQSKAEAEKTMQDVAQGAAIAKDANQAGLLQ
jgi:hypothetical protein